MPLVRFELKNEYGLGDSRLYQGARKEGEDPRNILGGFTVSGLVGILRQLGDLAEFAAVVFHDVHQQVLTTAARGHKVLNHIKKFEAVLPQFEKSVREQKSHIHFAYMTGCDWHANIQTGHRELLGSDLPDFMIDSYEKCRDPPSLHLLDKFDSAGAGACAKRYSDSTYFQRVMASSESIMVGKAYNGKKARRKKKQRSGGRNVLARHSVHMTLRSKSLNDSALFAPAVTDELKFSIDDPSTSDKLSVSGYTNELMHFSPDKTSGCLKEHNTPSFELHDAARSAIEAKTKHDVDRGLSNYSEVTVSDHVMLNSLLSTSISSNEKTEMVTSDSQMLSHSFSKEDLDISKSAELSFALSNGNHGIDGLGVQAKVVSNFSIWDKTTATWDEVNENMEATSPRITDEISSSRASYLARGQINELSSQLVKGIVETSTLGTKVEKQIEYLTGGVILLPHLNYECEVNMSSGFGTQPTPSIVTVNCDISPFRPHDPETLFLTLEQSNQHSEIIGTEILNQDHVLPTTVIGISELTDQLDKHMDSTNALHSLVKKKIECQTAQGMMSLPYLNYYGMECEVNRITGVASPSSDEVGGEIIPFRPQDAGLFLAPETSNLCCEVIGTEMLDQGSFLLNTMKMVEPSLPREELREPISELTEHMNATNASDYEVHTKFKYQNREVILFPNLNNDGCECEINEVPRIDIRNMYDLDGEIASKSCIPPEQSSSQDSSGDTLVKAASHNEVLSEHQTKQVESTAESNCQLSEYQSSVEKVIVASNTETLVPPYSSSDDYASLILSDMITSNTAVDVSSSTLSVEATSSRCLNHVFSPRNISEDQGSFLLNTLKMVEPSLSREELREQISELAEHMNATNASDYEVHTNFKYQNREVILFPNLNNDGGEYEINKVPRINIRNMYDLDGEIASESCIPPEQSSSQDSSGDTLAKAASHNEVFSEHQTKQVESTVESNCQLSEYQSSVEKVIVAANTETLVPPYSSSDDYASLVLSDMITYNTTDDVSSSTLSAEATSSRCLNHVFSPRNISEDPGGNMSTQIANTSIILPSTVTESTVVEFQGFPVDSFRKPSVNIWTNGGLLGLEPSKPSAFGVPSVYCTENFYDDRLSADSQTCQSGNQIESRNLFFEADKLESVVSFSEKDKFTDKVSDKQSDSLLSKQHSKDSIQASSICKVEKAQNSCFDGATSDIDRVNEKEGDSIFSEADICSKSEPESNLSKKNSIGISVSFSGLSHRFPVSSLQRKLSMTTISPFFELMNKDDKLDGSFIRNKHKEEPKLAISSTQLLQLGNKEDVEPGISEKFVSSCSDSSGYQSPPIKHMNISFQSINNSDASSMRLEFCNICHQGSVEGMSFPSFQLLSESFHPVMDGLLESDDDTFCRSCPYSSDDLTLRSESDDEMWGEDELYVSNRIEETCSISSPIDDENNRVSRVNHATNLKHGTNELSFTSK